MATSGIVVDIKAQITGYQEQVNKLQAALDKVKIGSGIGKELSQELNNIQRLINELNKHANIRITSDSGLNSLTDKLVNVATKIQEIGEGMQSLTVGDLDFSKLDKGAQDTLKEIQALRAELNSNMTEGLQQKLQSAIEHGSRLGRVLQRVNADIKSLDAEGGKQLLVKAFEDANTRAHTAANEIKELRGEIRQYKQDISTLENSKLKDPILNLREQLDALREASKITGAGAEKNFLPSESLQTVLTKWTENLSKVKMTADDAQDKVAQFFNALKGTTDLDQAKQTIREFINSFKELGTTKNNLQQAINVNDLIKTAVVDPQKVKEVEDTIRGLLQRVGDSIEGGPAAIEALLSVGDIDEARKATIRALTAAYKNIETESAQKKQALVDAMRNLGIKRTELGAAFAERTEASSAINNYEDIIKKLSDENADLRARKEVLENKFNQQIADQEKGIQKTGAESKIMGAEYAQAARQNLVLYQKELENVREKEQLVGKIENVVQRWFSIYAAVRMVGQAIRSVISTIQELDKTITEIAIVTDMTQDQLWSQMQSYTAMARQYAASISGVYQVSQLYYQQGMLNI